MCACVCVCARVYVFFLNYQHPKSSHLEGVSQHAGLYGRQGLLSRLGKNQMPLSRVLNLHEMFQSHGQLAASSMVVTWAAAS